MTALSSCGIGRVGRDNEEIEIALSRELLPNWRHQLCRALVLPLCAAFPIGNSRRKFSRASGRSGNISC